MQEALSPLEKQETTVVDALTEEVRKQTQELLEKNSELEELRQKYEATKKAYSLALETSTEKTAENEALKKGILFAVEEVQKLTKKKLLEKDLNQLKKIELERELKKFENFNFDNLEEIGNKLLSLMNFYRKLNCEKNG